MSIDQWTANLLSQMAPRFVRDDQTELMNQLQLLAGDLFSARVLTVRRTLPKGSGFRTILVAHSANLKNAGTVLHWAANVRDALPEPSAADLYLFLEVKNASQEDCLRLEADDQYCRKYVKRPGESAEEFVARTFLAAPVRPQQLGEMADPLSVSLHRAAQNHDWFTVEQQQYWRQILLSGGNSSDLAALLLGYQSGDEI